MTCSQKAPETKPEADANSAAIRGLPPQSVGRQKTAPDTPGGIMVSFFAKAWWIDGSDGGGDEGQNRVVQALKL
jgi:hypothetical protein